jgi:hypothetical protein
MSRHVRTWEQEEASAELWMRYLTRMLGAEHDERSRSVWETIKTSPTAEPALFELRVSA